MGVGAEAAVPAPRASPWTGSFRTAAPEAAPGAVSNGGSARVSSLAAKAAAALDAAAPASDEATSTGARRVVFRAVTGASGLTVGAIDGNNCWNHARNRSERSANQPG